LDNVIVIKQNSQGKETWRYSGKIIKRTANFILLEAYFNRSDLPFHGITFREGDRFVEAYFNDRWYNIFEVHDREDGCLKGWYCNVTRPAVFADGVISYVDLALDLLVYPDMQQLVLDEDEFEALNLDQEAALAAQSALIQLQALFEPTQGFQIQEFK
jgi:uncharacterized protein